MNCPRMNPAVLSQARKDFIQELIDTGTLAISDKGIASNADKNSRASRDVALHLAENLGVPVRQKLAGQTAGSNFENAVGTFLRTTIRSMAAVQPGNWFVDVVGSSHRASHVARYEPYLHLGDLAVEIENKPTLAAVLWNSYSIAPDILVTRDAYSDEALNAELEFVDEQAGLLSPMRASNTQPSSSRFLHAVVSCKFTMRSDRAQNTRSEALNLIRNRKGRAPHIIAITAEPMISRIASLALGTGDIDMVYHAALPELRNAVHEAGSEDAQEILEMLVHGRRLRDISDMPLDLIS